MKAPEACGVSKPSDLTRKLLMDGVWTRCSECCAAGAGTEDGAFAASDPAASAEALRRERARLEAEEEDAASEKILCTVCRTEKLFCHFTDSGLKHRDRAHRRCKECHVCSECHREFAGSAFFADAAVCRNCGMLPCGVCKKLWSTIMDLNAAFVRQVLLCHFLHFLKINLNLKMMKSKIL